MKNNSIVHSLGHAALVVLYIFGVVSLMQFFQRVFPDKDPQTIFLPIGILMLFILSATITSTLVFGRPVLLYVDGKKKEALEFLGWTVGWLFVLTAAVFLMIVASK